MAMDFADAILQTLRANGPCTQAFGDTWDPDTDSGTIKFWFDYSGQVAEPYAIFYETGETYEQMTMASGYTPEIISGRLECAVFAVDRTVARELGNLVTVALNDAAIQWPGEEIMLMRRTGARFQPTTDTGPNVPTVFCRVITFMYQYSQAML